jgi:hypothetical protein
VSGTRRSSKAKRDPQLLIAAEAAGITEERQRDLCDRLKRLGYGRNGQIRLYGVDYQLTSDPIVVADRVVLVDAIERSSGQSRRIPLPPTVLIMATQDLTD